MQLIDLPEPTPANFFSLTFLETQFKNHTGSEDMRNDSQRTAYCIKSCSCSRSELLY